MNRYITTTTDTQQDNRYPTRPVRQPDGSWKDECWWDIGNRGVESALIWPGTNNFVRADGWFDPAGITAWAKAHPGHDLVIFDHENTPYLTAEQGMGVVAAIRAGLSMAEIAFYGPWFGMPREGMSSGDFAHPSAAQGIAMAKEASRVAPYHSAAGAVLLNAQFMRPSDALNAYKIIRNQCDLANLYCPRAQLIVFLMDTINWPEEGYPAADGAFLGEIFDAADDCGASVCVFQPGAILPPPNLRPLYEAGWLWRPSRRRK